MATVKQILNQKGREVYSVAPEATVLEALQKLAEYNVGALPVVDDSGNIVGLFSERDYARKVVLQGKASKDVPVSEVMSSHVLYVTPETSDWQCMALMTDKRVRHLPVLEDGELVGFISIGDVVKAIMEDQKFHIEQLERYISSGMS
jgi:CBS domain-containing protein